MSTNSRRRVRKVPQVGEKVWLVRGVPGRWTVVEVDEGNERVTLKPENSTGPTLGKDKTISFKTLRGDYARLEG